ncbi:hypothetical protein FZC33_08325 [Labrys sp. KNU-23]|uniref:hypothetical protein n=1 Tax=Labrys sp. KNU-23 TaxID=2789216 RepID=UPI0011EE0EE7|nr:hypothetical protein [Labrys sp. KNU-23]QEN86179.1 hypothetical protein FZC33_08325 [Labrys sp. KNU-23]
MTIKGNKIIDRMADSEREESILHFTGLLATDLMDDHRLAVEEILSNLRWEQIRDAMKAAHQAGSAPRWW